MLSVRNLTVEVGGRNTLENGTFTVRAGDKAGLVGRNGAGKTSMLRILAGERPPKAGSVEVVGGLGYLTQDPKSVAVDDALSALERVLSGRELDIIAARIEKLRVDVESDPSEHNLGRYGNAIEDFERRDGYAAEAECRRLLAGLGLRPDRAELSLRVLSGGERRRVELARILFGGADVLMLDEPTNHLDADAKTWLLQYLRSYRGALLVISHDLELLDESINRVLHLDEGTIVEYRGTYTQYLRQRAADETRQASVAQRQQTEIQRISTLADKMRGQTAKRARVAKTLDKRVERMESAAITGPTKQRTMRVQLPDPPHAGRTVLEVKELTKSFDGPAVFDNVNFALERGERLLVLGLNGAGKTTLLRCIAGTLSAERGTVEFGLNVSAGYFAQEHETIIAGKRVIDHMTDAASLTDTTLRGVLGMLGISGDMAHQDAGTLSGGEKTKVALGMLVAGAHNLLLLDEPTNNLDPPSRAAIGDALAGWKGSMIIVSHDPQFVAGLEPQRVLIMPDGTLDHWSDDLADLIELA